MPRAAVDQCPFCAIAEGSEDAHTVAEETEVMAFLDRRPLFPGHVLVIPRAHHKTLMDLPDPLVASLFEATRRVARAVTMAMHADGSFVALNNVVSQSVPHLHVHVVPRKRGDGLKGFFWPRHAYPDEASMIETAKLIRAALTGGPGR